MPLSVARRCTSIIFFLDLLASFLVVLLGSQLQGNQWFSCIVLGYENTQVNYKSVRHIP
jgi:hypothetical protein